MKERISTIPVRVFLLCVLLLSSKLAGADNAYQNFYGIAWRGKAADNLRFARQMGYDYVFYQKGMKNSPLAAGLKFYIEGPEYHVYPAPRTFDLKKIYSPQQRKIYEKYFAWKSTEPFPHNLANGWFSTPTTFSVQFDFQQQAVIDEIVQRIIDYAKGLENKKIGFTFGGCAWDVATLNGDFWADIQKNKGRRITLAHWTGRDSSVLHPAITHQDATYRDGEAAYYKQLFKRIRQEWPNAKFIMEPSRIYDNWIKIIKDRPDSKSLMPDMLTQEDSGTQFVDDERIFSTDLITKNRVGSTTPNILGEYENRRHAAKASVNGAWFGWYGRFGGTGDMPNFQNIYEVPARVQLIRIIPNWENLADVPISKRRWDRKIYSSPNAYVSKNIIYARNPKTKKLFVVFLNTKEAIKLPADSKVISIQRTDRFFIESEDGRTDVIIDNGKVKLINAENAGRGYILQLQEDKIH